MKISWEVTFILFVSCYQHAENQSISLDGGVYRFIWERLTMVFGPSSDNAEHLRMVKKLQRLQPKVKNNVPFPCSVNSSRSNEPPKSAHILRPGDIDIVGALGDSLTISHGALAINPLQSLAQTRGLSPTAGGQKTWREYLTLPNILKEFNPRLIGYSSKDSFLNNNDTQFNVAEAAALSKDLPFMAEELIRRMANDPRVNMKTDWKMVTLWIGGFDFCIDMCYQKDPENVAEKHRKHLTTTLRTLRNHLPRTIVNIILAPHLNIIKNFYNTTKPPVCSIILNLLCPCKFNSQFEKQQDRFDQIMAKWQQVEADVASEPEFDTRDFTVVVQPFILNYHIPRTRKGIGDYSYMAPDCFHLSQKGAARVAISLWNNILEPVGKKSTAASELYDFKCPSLDHPFIFTRRNSARTRK